MRLGFRGNKDEKHDIVGLGRWASTKSRKKKNRGEVRGSVLLRIQKGLCMWELRNLS